MYIMIFKIKASKNSIECVYKSALVWNIETFSVCCIVVVNYILNWAHNKVIRNSFSL